MYNHEPLGYICPLCVFGKGGETEINKRSDVIYEDDQIMAFTSPKWWKNNPGNVMVVPKAHFENVYDIDDEVLAKISILGKKVAMGMKETYGCEGVSFRQHNEPAGNQDLWHFHLHVFPRNQDDDLYINHKNNRYTTPEERLLYAEKLRKWFTGNNF